MLTLPAEVIAEKNKLGTSSAWLVTAEIIFSGATVRIVNNNEDKVVSGTTYTAFPFQLEPVESNSKGELAAATLTVANPTRALQYYIELYDGGVDATVNIRIYSANYLTAGKEALTWQFKVMSSSCNDRNITLSLGASNPLMQKFPLFRYFHDHCNWKYRSMDCGYSGADPGGTYADPCQRNLESCEARNNDARFGGFPGLAPGGIKFG